MNKLTAAACALVALGSWAHAAERAPNILVILADDLGYADVGFNGCRDVPTPHIDSIASNGVRFTDGYVTAPICSPSRAGLLSGRMGTRFGFETNVGGSDQGGRNLAGLPRTEKLFSERMKELGHATGMFGKWHVGFQPELRPARRGFDDWMCFMGACRSYFPGGGDTVVHNGTPVKKFDYATYLYADEAAAFIERHQEHPWFLYLPFSAVHGPLEATDELKARFPNLSGKRRIFAGMLSALDDGVGRVLAKLRALKLEEHTLVFFVSDNGGPTWDNTSRNDPLRGEKGTLWEGGIREPFALQWKGRIPAGQVYRQPVSTLDIQPTALAACGAPADPKLEGVDLLPFLTGARDGAPHEVLCWRMFGQRACRKGDWKITDPGEGGFRLYNLAEDIGEKRDLAAQQPERLQELAAAYDAWDAGNIPPLWAKHGALTEFGRKMLKKPRVAAER